MNNDPMFNVPICLIHINDNSYNNSSITPIQTFLLLFF